MAEMDLVYGCVSQQLEHAVGTGATDHARRREELEMSSLRATFSLRTYRSFILLEDQNQGMSITNDAEAVIEHLAGLFDLSKFRILYRDSEGRWDELLSQNDIFIGFKVLGAVGTWRNAVACAFPSPDDLCCCGHTRHDHPWPVADGCLQCSCTTPQFMPSGIGDNTHSK